LKSCQNRPDTLLGEVLFVRSGLSLRVWQSCTYNPENIEGCDTFLLETDSDPDRFCALFADETAHVRQIFWFAHYYYTYA
jgi:hypothetical protein